jgi:hypothetical protein
MNAALRTYPGRRMDACLENSVPRASNPLKNKIDKPQVMPLSWRPMNRSPLAKVLLAILAVIAFWSLGLCWSYFGHTRELRERQAQINNINQRQQIFGMLLNDAAEYSKLHPAMEPLLRSIGNTPAPATGPAAKAPGK